MRSAVAKTLALAAVAPAVWGADCGPPPGKTSPWARLADFRSVPTHRAERMVRFSSHDRGDVTGTIFGPMNKDNNNFLAICGTQPPIYLPDDDGLPCEDGANGFLLAKVSGERGWVNRMWFAKAPEDRFDEPWHNQRLVVYLDDLQTPAIDVPMFVVKLGLAAALPPPFTGQRSGGLSTYAPLAFERELRVYMRGADSDLDIVYYHVDVTLTDEEVVPFAPNLSLPDAAARAEAAAKWGALGANPNAGFTNVLLNAPRVLAPGAETVLFSENAAGTIERLEIALPESSQAGWDALRLRMTWDGAAAPQVDLPLSSFWGMDLARSEHEGLFLGHRAAGGASTLYAYLPMPYRASARIAIRNDGASSIDAAATVGVDRTLPPEPFGLLHAVRSEALAPTAPAHVVADLAGRGTLAGVLFSIRGRADPGLAIPNPMNYLEGDERIAIDGRPPLLGTGTEEIADGAWYFQPGAFDAAFSGATLVHRIDDERGETAHYRWYVQTGGLHFSESLRYEVEYGVQNPAVVDRWVSTAFWYRAP